VPFPRDESVSSSQARYLESLERLVHGRVVGLLRKSQRGEELTVAELYGLSVAFGHDALRAADHVGEYRANDHRHAHETTADALGHLLDRWSTLLRRKVERLHVLARRARGGYVLGADELEEIEETWGGQWAEQLDRSGPRLAGPACVAMEQDPREALAALSLTEDDGTEWSVRPDLLDAEVTNRAVVVEVDDEGIAHLRFGDSENGRAVDPGTTLRAKYRVGNGAAGNVGAEVISRIVLCETEQAEIVGVRNPLPACGGVDPETTAEVKLFAPLAFRRYLMRAVTASDYAMAAGSVTGVQRAAAELAWTGSWYEADVGLDPFGDEETSPQLARQVAERLYRYRRIGHDVRVRPADYVPIDLGLWICVLPHYQRGEVEKAVLDLLSNRLLPDGGRGFFHPENLTFGAEVALSSIVASVQAVNGVQSVDVLRFERLGEGDHGELARGVLRLGSFEIARLDNDRLHPENGRLTLELRGGR
jgi:predicted phage baseplate assembly protein